MSETKEGKLCRSPLSGWSRQIRPKPLAGRRKAHPCNKGPGELLHPHLTAAKCTLCSLARRNRRLIIDEVREPESEIGRLTRSVAPSLVDASGVGPDTAATLLIAAGSNPDRLHSKAAFASL